MYTNKNAKYVSSSRVIHISYTLQHKVPKTLYFLFLKELLTQISIALYFIILAPELERAFGKANCRVLIYLVLYGQMIILPRYSFTLTNFIGSLCTVQKCCERNVP